MSINLTGEKCYEKITLLPSQLKDVVEDHDVQEKGVSFAYSLVILDRIKKCSILDDESQMMMLSTLPRKFEDFQSKNKKQKSIKAYFS